VSSGTARADEPEPAPIRRTGRTDPLRSADDVLARAAEAREAAMKGGRRGMAREEEARRALAELKASRGHGGAPVADPDDDEADEPKSGRPKPRKRTL
jgi:hypothetical protein